MEYRMRKAIEPSLPNSDLTACLAWYQSPFKRRQNI
jgi:hypothetical protein